MNSDSGISHLCVEDFLDLCATESQALRSGLFPLADVRSPSEFLRGHIPGAVNIPLFSDEERAEVGTLYKREGRAASVMRGLELVGPKLGELPRAAFALCRGRTGGELAIYCSRGGMRSASVGWLLTMVGLRVHILEGGYKAFRRHTLSLFEQPHNLLVLGGKTGSGKTRVLARMAARGAQVVDLEGLARHRGSAFGALADKPQPSCEQFENNLAVDLGRIKPGLPVWVEDESENLGSVNLPRAFYRQLRASPVLVLEVSDQARMVRVLEDYGTLPREYMGQCLDHIKKRLGGLEHARARASLAEGDLPGLAAILLGYYDRAYAKQAVNRPPAAVVRTDDPEEAAETLMELGF